jgi:cytochrome c oxidase assembly factor CtaG
VRQLVSAWDPAPVVLVGAGLTLVLFAQGSRRLRQRGRNDHADWTRAWLFLVAVAIATLALVSPLDEVGDSYLLSGHMLQHVLIGDVAPALALVALRGPLIFFFLPCSVLRALARSRWVRNVLGFLLRPTLSFVAWIAVIAAWHVPVVYDYALRDQAVHDLEHVSFILVGLLVWTQILDPARRRRLRVSERVAYMFGLCGTGAVLAGVLVLSSTPLYPAYAGGGPRLLGLSPLRDQQLAGIVMVGEQLLTLGLCICFLLGSRVRAGRGSGRTVALDRRLATSGS